MDVRALIRSSTILPSFELVRVNRRASGMLHVEDRSTAKPDTDTDLNTIVRSS